MCENETFRVAAVHHWAFRFPGKEGNIRFGGKDFNILESLSRALFFNFNIVSPLDAQWGLCNQMTNHCTGIVGMVARKEADMGISTVTLTTGRTTYVDFSFPYNQDSMSFITKAPSFSKTSNTLFLKEPMQIQAWILNFCFLAIIVLIVKLVTRTMNENIMLWNIVELTLRQGITIKSGVRSAISVVVLATAILLFGTIEKLYECYLTSATSLAPVTLPIDTFEQLAHLVKTKHYVVKGKVGSASQEILMNSDLEYLKVFVNATKESSFAFTKSVGEGLDNILRGNVAYFASKFDFEVFISTAKYPRNMFHLAREALCMQYNSIAFHKSFPCKDQISKWLNILLSTGLMNKWTSDDKLYTSRNGYQPTYEIEPDSVNYIEMDDLKLVFYVLAAVGWGCACVIHILQGVTWQRRKKVTPSGSAYEMVTCP